MKRFEVYEEEDGYCFVPEGQTACVDPGAKLIHVIEASTWNEAMTKYYLFQDWGTYKPMEGDDGQEEE